MLFIVKFLKIATRIKIGVKYIAKIKIKADSKTKIEYGIWVDLKLLLILSDLLELVDLD